MRAVFVVALFASAACGSDKPGTANTDAPIDPTGDGEGSDTGPTGPRNIMFVTSTTHAGDLGGLDGADAICNARAQAGGLAGTFVAYLSTAAVDAKDRLAGSRGWVRPDDKPFVDTVDDLVAGKILYPPRIDEMKADVTMTDAFTGSTTAGVEDAGHTCGDWASTSGSSAYGSPFAGDTYWGANGTGNCTLPRRLYCFGVGATIPVHAPSVAGKRRAFVAYWVPGSGRDAADAACATAASGAGISGTFKALLGTSQENANARFSASGANWVRHDGVEVANTPADLLAGTLAAPILYEASGAFPTQAMGYVITGGMPNQKPAAGASCNNWMSMSINDSVQAGTLQLSTRAAFDRTGILCDANTRAMYCLQQ